jgi:hypothetical protein
MENFTLGFDVDATATDTAAGADAAAGAVGAAVAALVAAVEATGSARIIRIGRCCCGADNGEMTAAPGAGPGLGVGGVMAMRIMSGVGSPVGEAAATLSSVASPNCPYT